MKTIEVLLRENVESLGRCGDVVRVKPGYARNYLLPEGLATSATEDNKQAMARRRLRLDAEEAERMAEIETRVLLLAAVKLETIVRADEHGRLYGSVNAAQVAELLAAQGREVAEKAVRIDVPIKEVGAHTVRVHVHGERYAEVALVVSPEGGLPVAAEPAEEATEAEAADQPEA